MTDEPVYEYIKGQGWVPGVKPSNALSCLRRHNGILYRITIRKPEVGDIIKRGEYANSHVNGGINSHTLDSIEWWEEWEGIPAGFGGGMNNAYYENQNLIEVLTEVV